MVSGFNPFPDIGFKIKKCSWLTTRQLLDHTAQTTIPKPSKNPTATRVTGRWCSEENSVAILVGRFGHRKSALPYIIVYGSSGSSTLLITLKKSPQRNQINLSLRPTLHVCEAFFRGGTRTMAKPKLIYFWRPTTTSYIDSKESMTNKLNRWERTY